MNHHESDYYTPEELAVKFAFFRPDGTPDAKKIKERAYRHKMPGQAKILNQWRFRKVDVNLALLNGKL